MSEKYYLSKRGVKALEKKLRELKEKKLEIIRKKAPAKQDYREAGFEYVEYQEDLAQIQKKIKQIESVLKNYELIEVPPEGERGKIRVGARVRVEVEGEVDEFEITGRFEAEPEAGRISVRSPVGEALLGKEEGEEIEIKAGTTIIYKVMEINYKK